MDRDALLTDLYTRYWPTVCGFLVWLTGGNRAQAEDLAQETFLRAWGALDHVTLDAGAVLWLRAIAKRVHHDAVRHAHGQGKVRHYTVPWRWPDPLREDEERPVPDPAPGPEAQVVLAEAAREAQAIYARMRPAYRRAIWLDWQGATLEESARALRISPGAVKSLRWRAHQAAREGIE